MYKLITFCVLCITQFIVASNYYVSGCRTDSKLGAITQSFKKIQMSRDVSKAGDLIFVRDGDNYKKSSSLFIAQNGNFGSPIIFKSYLGDPDVIRFSSSGSPSIGWTCNGYKDYLIRPVFYHLVEQKIFCEGE